MTDLTYSQSHQTAYRREVFKGSERGFQLPLLFRNWQIRRKVRALGDYNDHLLDDMGVQRDEIAWAANLPLSINASIALNDRASRRRSHNHSRSRSRQY